MAGHYAHHPVPVSYTHLDVYKGQVYLYDEKVLIAFNYKDGTKTITFDEIAAKDAPEGNEMCIRDRNCTMA